MFGYFVDYKDTVEKSMAFNTALGSKFYELIKSDLNIKGNVSNEIELMLTDFHNKYWKDIQSNENASFNGAGILNAKVSEERLKLYSHSILEIKRNQEEYERLLSLLTNE